MTASNHLGTARFFLTALDDKSTIRNQGVNWNTGGNGGKMTELLAKIPRFKSQIPMKSQ
jgi:hypothetical protein